MRVAAVAVVRFRPVVFDDGGIRLRLPHAVARQANRRRWHLCGSAQRQVVKVAVSAVLEHLAVGARLVHLIVVERQRRA